MSDDIGQTIGKFRIEGLITTGSTGTIYKAVDVSSQEPVALRIFNSRMVSDASAKQRLLSQAQLVGTLSHPNIAKVEGFGEHDGRVYVATELAPDGPIVSSALTAPGRPLRSHSLWGRLDLVRQAADGLDFAHKKNVFHLDLNPKTLLLKQTAPDLFLAKVVDFGLAAALDSASTAAADIPGSPAFLAPEQWQASQVDARTDIYAIGIVLYQLATGVLPFSATAPASAMYNHLYVAPQRPCQVRPDLPSELEAVILRCLAKKAQDRFASAGELSAALRKIVTEREAAAVSITFAETAGGEALAIRPATLPAVRPEPAPGPIAVPSILSKSVKGLPCFYVLDQRGTVVRRGYVQGAGTTFGSAADNLVVLESAEISPHHARIDWDGHHVTLTDLGSKTSTFLDEHRLLPQVPQEWVGSQQARVGPYWLTIEQSSPDVEASDVMDVIVERNCRTMTLAPGKASECRVTLANHRTTVDHVSVSVEGIPSEWVQGTGSEVALNPYDKQEVLLTIHVPRASSSIAGEYPVTIRANSVANPDQPGEAKVRWTVAPFDGATLGVLPSKTSGRKKGKYSVTVHNQGNRPAAYSLSAADDDRVLGFFFRTDNQNQQNRPRIELAPGARSSVQLSAEAPKWHLLGAARPHNFRIQAAPQEHGEPLNHEALLLQSPLMPTWMLIALPVLLIGLLFVVPQIAKPSFRSITVEPDFPYAGQVVKITWDAARAGRIEIRPLRAGIPADGGTYSIPQGLQQTTVLNVIASNFFGTDQRDITVPVRPIPAVEHVTIAASKERITKGESVTINWNASEASRVEFSEQGNAGLQGSYTDTPQADHTYTLTAFNSANVPTARSVVVKVEEVVAAAPPKPRLRVNKSLIRQGQAVIFTWEAPEAETARIDSVSTTTLIGSSGQKQAVLKGKGRYTFVVVSSKKGLENRSDPVTVDVECSIIQTATKRCNSNQLIQW